MNKALSLVRAAALESGDFKCGGLLLYNGEYRQMGAVEMRNKVRGGFAVSMIKKVISMILLMGICSVSIYGCTNLEARDYPTSTEQDESKTNMLRFIVPY